MFSMKIVAAGVAAAAYKVAGGASRFWWPACYTPQTVTIPTLLLLLLLFLSRLLCSLHTSNIDHPPLLLPLLLLFLTPLFAPFGLVRSNLDFIPSCLLKGLCPFLSDLVID